MNFLSSNSWNINVELKKLPNKRLGTINYWKTRREAKERMSNKNNYKIWR